MGVGSFFQSRLETSLPLMYSLLSICNDEQGNFYSQACELGPSADHQSFESAMDPAQNRGRGEPRRVVCLASIKPLPRKKNGDGLGRGHVEFDGRRGKKIRMRGIHRESNFGRTFRKRPRQNLGARGLKDLWHLRGGRISDGGGVVNRM